VIVTFSVQWLVVNQTVSSVFHVDGPGSTPWKYLRTYAGRSNATTVSPSLPLRNITSALHTLHISLTLHINILCGYQYKYRLLKYTVLNERFFIIQTECVYCAVRTESLLIIQYKIILKYLGTCVSQFSFHIAPIVSWGCLHGWQMSKISTDWQIT
jgi:hypothetical protein